MNDLTSKDNILNYDIAEYIYITPYLKLIIFKYNNLICLNYNYTNF